jgi:RNA polymerase sigma-70 factor (ECF subfamily)
MSDDRDLALKAMRGDHEAFGELVRRHQTGVYNAAYRMTGNRQDAEDAAQEAFIRAYRAIGSLNPSRPPGPWFRKIAVNVCLNRLEKRPVLPLEDEHIVPQPSTAPGISSGPEPQTIEREQSREIRGALLTLAPRYRAVIELRHFQELSYIEMAEVLDRPLSDVKSDLFRARRMLAERLKERP